MTAGVDQGLPASARFHTKRDYGRVFYRQQKGSGRWCVVLLAPRQAHWTPPSRLGLMVSTKVHKHAVRRHQIKRWIREWFRTSGKQQATGFDVVVLVRSDPPVDGHAEFARDCQRSLEKALRASAQPGSQVRRKKSSKS
ncbi:MAG: ribonuclease P protein component [Planctomycetota bacterium]|nr:MAG: ribonuclease P protein component [Planctomycetota bacterium]